MFVSLLSPFIQFSNPFYCETQSGLSPAVNSVQCQKVTGWSWFGHWDQALQLHSLRIWQNVFFDSQRISKKGLRKIMRREHINKTSSS